MSTIDPKWEDRYRAGDTPWDSGIPSRELEQLIAEQMIVPGETAIELGCGTGTNAVWLAERGFAVTAVDGAPAALEQARRRAADAQVELELIAADVCRLPGDLPAFDFVFDRGCYHCVRQNDLAGFLESLRRITRSGTRCLFLTGNANEPSDHGPPRLQKHEIRADLEPLFRIERVREFRFEDRGGVPGPLGWSCLMRRR